MKKRNLIFVAAVSAAVLGVSLYAPVYRGLMNAGLVISALARGDGQSATLHFTEVK